jgi:hypothetical protein
MSLPVASPQQRVLNPGDEKSEPQKTINGSHTLRHCYRVFRDSEGEGETRMRYAGRRRLDAVLIIKDGLSDTFSEEMEGRSFSPLAR